MRRWAALAAAAMALTTANGCGAQGNDPPAAGPSDTTAVVAPPGKQVRDERAGVAYPIPDAWEEQAPDDLVGFFTSAVAYEGKPTDGKAAPAALVGAGLFENTSYDPRAGLREAAVRAAQGFAEFLIPASRHEPARSDRSTQLGGHDAWRADYSVDGEVPDQQRSTVTVIAVGAPQPFFLVALVGDADAEIQRAVDAILSGAESCPRHDRRRRLDLHALPGPWPLRLGAVGQNRGRLDGVVDAVDRCERPVHAVEAVGLLERVLRVPHSAIEDDREFKSWSPHWSWR